MSEILKVERLNVEYMVKEKGFYALDDVSLSVREGEIFGIVGESGSGKSTLALSILNILPDNAQTQGNIFFREKDILSFNENQLRVMRGKDIGMIFQEPASSFNPVLTIGYQFCEFLRAKLKIKDNAELSELALANLKRARIEDPGRIMRSYPHQLSGGLLQRALIAMAISTRPSLLIADEPTSSLDVTIESQIINLFKKIKQEYKLTIIFITHNLELVKILCDRVAVIYKGRIVDCGDQKSVFGNPESDYTRELIRSVKNLDSDVV